MAEYSPPVDRLLTLGEPSYDPPWEDYRALGLTAAHIPALIHLATDRGLRDIEDEDDDAAWGPVHAWRALMQLHAVEAARPLLELLEANENGDDEWVTDEMPLVLARIGPPILPELLNFLHDTRRSPYARTEVVQALQELVAAHPELRDECAQALIRVLEHAPEYDPTLNARVVQQLARWQVVEAASQMEQAFAAGRVDENISGGWERIRDHLGIRPESTEEETHPFGPPPVFNPSLAPERAPPDQEVLSPPRREQGGRQRRKRGRRK